MCSTRHENNVARSSYKKETISSTSASTVASSKPNFRKSLTSQESPTSSVEVPSEVVVPRQDKPRKPATPVEEGWTKIESKPRGRPAKKE